MTIQELRQQWLRLAEQARASIMGKYHAQRLEGGSAGREGLGIYSIYQERLARKKVQLAVKLLKRTGLEPTIANIRKLTGQSYTTIEYHLPRRVREAPEEQVNSESKREPGKVLPFRWT